MRMKTAFPDQSVIGQFRRFGPLGPAYQVMQPIKTGKDGDWLIRIRILNTGEETDYRYSHLKNDPVAR